MNVVCIVDEERKDSELFVPLDVLTCTKEKTYADV